MKFNEFVESFDRVSSYGLGFPFWFLIVALGISFIIVGIMYLFELHKIKKLRGEGNGKT